MANKNNEVIGLEELSVYDALIKHYIDNKMNSSGGGGNSGTSTSIEVNSEDSAETDNRLVYLKVNGTSYKAFTLYDISHKNFCYYLSYKFQDTTDDEKYNLNFIGTEIYGENLNFYLPRLSFINASIYISESSSKTLFMPISSTVDFSNIYSSGPLVNVKLTFYITKEYNTWYLNIKKSTPINLSTYGTTASLQILY